MADDATIRVGADVSGAAAEFKKLREGMVGALETGAAKGSFLGSILADVVVAGARAAADSLIALGKVTFEAGVSMVKAANAQEEAVDALEDVIRQTGAEGQRLSLVYQDIATNMARATGVADQELLPQMAKLISIGNVHEKQMGRATQAALDLSSGLGIELNQAFMLVAKAAAGKTEALGKLGIKVEGVKGQAVTFADVLKTLETRFQGAAEVDTFEGSLNVLRNTLTDAQEEGGKILTMFIEPLIPLVQEAADKIDRLSIAVHAWFEEHRVEILERATDGIKAVGGAISETISDVERAAKVYRRMADDLLAVLVPFGHFQDATDSARVKLNLLFTAIQAGIRMIPGLGNAMGNFILKVREHAEEQTKDTAVQNDATSAAAKYAEVVKDVQAGVAAMTAVTVADTSAEKKSTDEKTKALTIMERLKQMNEELDASRGGAKDDGLGYTRDATGGVHLKPSGDSSANGLNIVGMNAALAEQNKAIQAARKEWEKAGATADATKDKWVDAARVSGKTVEQTMLDAGKSLRHTVEVSGKSRDVIMADLQARANASRDAWNQSIADMQNAYQAYEQIRVSFDIGGGRSANVDQDFLGGLAEKARKGKGGGQASQFYEAFAKMLERGDTKGMEDIISSMRGQAGALSGMIGQGRAVEQFREAEMFFSQLLRKLEKEESKREKDAARDKKADEEALAKKRDSDSLMDIASGIKMLVDKQDRPIVVNAAFDGREIAALVSKRIERQEAGRT